jgi:predicted transcriptional regulator of viral defense system/very-short-patch-repair endonuclease
VRLDDQDALGVRQKALAVGQEALAVSQHDVFTLEQVVALGLRPRAVQKRAAAGRLHRIHQGVYSPSPAALLSLKGRYMAAVLACRPGAVLSHRSAAALHELRATSRTRIEVTVPGRTGRSHSGIQVHRSTTLTPADITTVDGIPVTTIARTILDLATVLPRRAVERAMDQAEILQALDGRALEDQLERNHRLAAARLIRSILERHRVGTTPTRNDFEERLFALVRTANLPEPEVNAWVIPPDGGSAFSVDFLWRQQRLIIETDGYATHGTRQAFEGDRRRDQLLTLAGWRIIRITWLQLVEEPEQTAQLIAGLLAADAA